MAAKWNLAFSGLDFQGVLAIANGYNGDFSPYFATYIDGIDITALLVITNNVFVFWFCSITCESLNCSLLLGKLEGESLGGVDVQAGLTQIGAIVNIKCVLTLVCLVSRSLIDVRSCVF